MTEVEWLACTDPKPMLAFVGGKASSRKLRLFAVACCRMIWPLITNVRSRKSVEMSEACADDPSKHKVMIAAAKGAKNAISYTHSRLTYPEWMGVAIGFIAARDCALADAREAAHSVTGLITRVAWPDHESSARNSVAFLRDIIGDPFRPSRSLPSAVLNWNGGTVCRIARGIYDEHAFDRLPILHDALLDAGCNDEAILAHCRERAPHIPGCWFIDPSGPHVRGCWVVDLLLGKE
jgi:hypothetical protein